nr:MAG TPA: hypothetical protein [Caudoviricetes sp.]
MPNIHFVGFYLTIQLHEPVGTAVLLDRVQPGSQPDIINQIKNCTTIL